MKKPLEFRFKKFIDLVYSDSPYVDEIAADGWKLDKDGMLPIPDAPGLGLTLNMDALAKYTRGEPLLV